MNNADLFMGWLLLAANGMTLSFGDFSAAYKLGGDKEVRRVIKFLAFDPEI